MKSDKYYYETVLTVKHWNETLFSFTATRNAGLRFRNGEFVMIGIEVEGKPLMRAYSIASPNYSETIEFFSIKVPDGPLTSRLQHLKVGDQVLFSKKPTGTLVIDDLREGRNLYLLNSGTGLAPFMSIIQDPETYTNFEKVILTHSVRWKSELAYDDFIKNELPNNEFFGDLVAEKLIYYPSVTREEFTVTDRLTTLLENGKIASDNGLEPIDASKDRAMICGSPAFLKDIREKLEAMGFEISKGTGEPGDFVIERAFVGEEYESGQ